MSLHRGFPNPVGSCSSSHLRKGVWYGRTEAQETGGICCSWRNAITPGKRAHAHHLAGRGLVSGGDADPGHPALCHFPVRIWRLLWRIVPVGISHKAESASIPVRPQSQQQRSPPRPHLAHRLVPYPGVHRRLCRPSPRPRHVPAKRHQSAASGHR